MSQLVGLPGADSARTPVAHDRCWHLICGRFRIPCCSGCSLSDGDNGTEARTFGTLVQMARDAYPHDRVGDEYYLIAVRGYDTTDAAP